MNWEFDFSFICIEVKVGGLRLFMVIIVNVILFYDNMYDLGSFWNIL